MGSAALNLCYVAAGKLDAYWATSVNLWDVAAGLLFVEEAGGVITSINGGPLSLIRPRLLASATRPLHEELLVVLDIGPTTD
jgi:myo-inositol-1(or 4)-monophosphatase